MLSAKDTDGDDEEALRDLSPVDGLGVDVYGQALDGVGVLEEDALAERVQVHRGDGSAAQVRVDEVVAQRVVRHGAHVVQTARRQVHHRVLADLLVRHLEHFRVGGDDQGRRRRRRRPAGALVGVETLAERTGAAESRRRRRRQQAQVAAGQLPARIGLLQLLDRMEDAQRRRRRRRLLEQRPLLLACWPVVRREKHR